jgi:hypothetical protein
LSESQANEFIKKLSQEQEPKKWLEKSWNKF